MVFSRTAGPYGAVLPGYFLARDAGEAHGRIDFPL
jgi:hypothetical protein